MTAADAIAAAFPGEENLPVRAALLRLVHAAENAEHGLRDIAALIQAAIAERVPWWHKGDVAFAVGRLRLVIAELEHADVVLADAWKNLDRPTGEPADGDIRRPDDLGQPAGENLPDDGGEFPF